METDYNESMEEDIPNETMLFIVTHCILYGDQLYPYPLDVPANEIFFMVDEQFFMEPNDNVQIEREPPYPAELLEDTVVLNQARPECEAQYNEWGKRLTVEKHPPQRGLLWSWLRGFLISRGSMAAIWLGCVPFCDMNRMFNRRQSAIREALLRMLAFKSSAIQTITPDLTADDVFRGFNHEVDGVDAAEKRAHKIIPGMKEEMKNMQLVDFPRLEHSYFYWLTSSLDPSKGTGKFMIFETKCKKPPKHIKIPATHRPGMKPPHPPEPDEYYEDKFPCDPHGSGIYYHQVQNQMVNALDQMENKEEIVGFVNQYFVHNGKLKIVRVFQDPLWSSKYLPQLARMLRYMHRLRRHYEITAELYHEKNKQWEIELRENERKQRKEQEDKMMESIMSKEELEALQKKRRRDEEKKIMEDFFAGNKRFKSK